MRNNTYSDSEHTRQNSQLPGSESMTPGELPNRLMTAFEVAAFVPNDFEFLVLLRRIPQAVAG